MPINQDRVQRDIDVIASFSEAIFTVGYSRPTFSSSWRKARDYVIDELKKVGCVIRIDAAGNVFSRPASMIGKKVWLCGSHIDSVPTGGKYDGVTGIVVPLEIIRNHPNIEMELVIFAEEEGPTFGLGMLGSRAMVGELTAVDLGQLTNAAGQTYLQAGAPHGVIPDKISEDLLNTSAYHGLIEVHVEQGPALWNNHHPLAVVNAIAGRKQYKCKVTGEPNHAGSTGMADRFDALAGAATMIISLESLAKELSKQTVMTVGRLQVSPNAVNVIPGMVDFTIDFRSPDAAILETGELRMQQIFNSITRARHLKFAMERTENAPVVKMDERICQRLRSKANNIIGEIVPDAVSGALHDSAIIAPHLPTAMLFVASEGGVSHNPAEFTRVEDIVKAIAVVYAVIQEGGLL